ncbi:MAG: PDZ domain-containing protein [Deltaproteobacteria bacterium]|nr:PDZ domain-containing protein [Deltaproteobacteria bacterium]
MRRFQALLVVASMAAGPAVALANSPRDPGVTIERHEVFTSKGRLGVMLMSLTPELRRYMGAAEDRGVLVARVEPGSAAEAAGLSVGDVIVEARGRAVDGASDVLAALAEVKKGQEAEVQVVRDKQPLTVQVTMTEDPSRFPMQMQMHMQRMPFGDDDDDFFQWSDRWMRDFMSPDFDPREHFFQRHEPRGPQWLPDLMKPWKPQKAPPQKKGIIGPGSTSA